MAIFRGHINFAAYGLKDPHVSDRGTDRITLFWVPTDSLSMPLKRGPFSAHRGLFEGPQE